MKQSHPIESERQNSNRSDLTVSNASPVSQVFVDNRESTAIQRQLMAKMAHSPRAIAQRKYSEQMNSKPRMLAQRRQKVNASGSAVQKKVSVIEESAAAAQLKPQSIKEDHVLHVNDEGEVTNPEAGRDNVPVSYPMNAIIFHGIINADPVIGGHLFKREYGGQDDFSNVVTWSAASERSFTTYENAYLNDARQEAATTGAHDRIITTEAKFVSSKVNVGRLPGMNLKDKSKPAKLARHKVSRLIKGGVESIPGEVKVTAQGRKAWQSSGQAEFLGSDLFPLVKGATALYVRLKANEEVERVETALDKIDEM